MIDFTLLFTPFSISAVPVVFFPDAAAPVDVVVMALPTGVVMVVVVFVVVVGHGFIASF